MWHRALLSRGRHLSGTDVARDLSGLPRRIVAGRRRGPSALGREVLATLGRAHGWFRWVRPGHVDAPRFVGPDPMGPATGDRASGPQR